MDVWEAIGALGAVGSIVAASVAASAAREPDTRSGADLAEPEADGLADASVKAGGVEPAGDLGHRPAKWDLGASQSARQSA